MDLRQEEIRYQDGREQSVHCMHRHVKSSNPRDRIFTDLHYHEYIELLYGLEGDAKLDKRAPLVVSMKEWVDAQYEEGRQTAMTDKELEEKIAQLAPELHKA